MTSQRLSEAIQHRERKEFEQAAQILSELLNETPDDPQVNYQMAWLCDTQGKESEAVPFYERAISNGLDGEELQGALLGLGSTYRCLGRYEQAVETLRNGMTTFPDAGEFPVFLAMALYNTGQYAEAMSLLLRSLAETSEDKGISDFKNAILFYHDKLDQVWD
jgi:tetratricopeptide (TPR) repeat protein